MKALFAVLLLGLSADPNVEFIAHRGESHDAPENTLAAFRLAWERNVSTIELDVYQTIDGELIVTHDADTKKTTGVEKVIKDSTLAELRTLDAGRWKGERFAGEKLPTLREALATIPDRGRCFIELKTGPEVVPALTKVISASGKRPEQLAIISFNSTTIAETKRRLPQHQAYWIASVKADKKTGVLTPTVDELIAKAKDIKADGLDLSIPPTRDYTEPVKAAGLKLFIWTINDAETARKFVTLGVDGITTDRAAWLKEQVSSTPTSNRPDVGVRTTDEQPTPGKQVQQSHVSPALPGEKLGYLLFLPKDYDKDERQWPVMLFLHGSGERGDDLNLVKVHGPPKLVESRPDFPFIAVSPQCPKDQSWFGEVQPHLLAELLDSVLTRFRADPQRVVVTGLSMGGFGSWTLTARYPSRFAAAVPICGGGDPDDAPQLKSLPVWVFHGAKDTGVPLKLSEDMVAAIQKAGGHAKLTVYPEAGHDSWTETYNNNAVYDWLLAQKRTSPAPLPTASPHAAFVRVGVVDLKLGKPEDKNTFAAHVFLTTSQDCEALLRERIASQRDQLRAAFLAWVNAQPTEELVGKVGRERTRVAARELVERIVFRGQQDIPFDVAFDMYFVRHNGRLRLEAK